MTTKDAFIYAALGYLLILTLGFMLSAVGL